MWNVIENKKCGTSMMFWGRKVNPNWLSLRAYARVIQSEIYRHAKPREKILIIHLKIDRNKQDFNCGQ